MKRLSSLLGCLLLAGALVGCSSTKLESGGAYAPVDAQGNAIIKPDFQFFVADAAFKLAYNTVDAGFKFEQDNRLFLWQLTPNIKHTMDQVRPQAVKARDDYARARAAYMAVPTPAGLTQLQNILGQMQQIASAVQAVLPVNK